MSFLKKLRSNARNEKFTSEQYLVYRFKKNVTIPMMFRYCCIFAVDLSQTKGIES
jgi:hypothetical protein